MSNIKQLKPKDFEQKAEGGVPSYTFAPQKKFIVWGSFPFGTFILFILLIDNRVIKYEKDITYIINFMHNYVARMSGSRGNL